MCRLQGPEWVRAELARARPFLKAHQADIAQYHTHPRDTEASEGLGHLYIPTPTAKKGSTLPHRWKAPACPTPRKEPSLHQPCWAVSTHKALIFSVTSEVYCGSVCGKTKCPP